MIFERLSTHFNRLCLSHSVRIDVAAGGRQHLHHTLPSSYEEEERGGNESWMRPAGGEERGDTRRGDGQETTSTERQTEQARGAQREKV